MIKAVVFDLDDTLTPEIDYIKSGYLHVAELISNKLNMQPQFIFKKLLELFKVDSRRVFNRFFDELCLPYSQHDIAVLVESYRNHMPIIQFYDDVIPCLRDLRAKGTKTGIITDGYKCAQRNKLRALNADYFFDNIIITDELGREYWKPHPLPFKLMSEQLGVSFGEMMYVGDNPEKDFYISKTFPIRTVRICRKELGYGGIYDERKYYNEIREDLRIDTLESINKYLSRF